MPRSPDPARDADDRWLIDWLTAVSDGTAAMSQRARSSIDRHGRIDRAVALARDARVHLIELTDDEGRIIVAASRQPICALC